MTSNKIDLIVVRARRKVVEFPTNQKKLIINNIIKHVIDD